MMRQKNLKLIVLAGVSFYQLVDRVNLLILPQMRFWVTLKLFLMIVTRVVEQEKLVTEKLLDI